MRAGVGAACGRSVAQLHTRRHQRPEDLGWPCGPGPAGGDTAGREGPRTCRTDAAGRRLWCVLRVCAGRGPSERTGQWLRVRAGVAAQGPACARQRGRSGALVANGLNSVEAPPPVHETAGGREGCW